MELFSFLVAHLPKMQEDSPKAILQQKVPCAFINLQEQIEEKSREMNHSRIPPVMEEEEFRNAFLRFVEDEEELEEAVFFLNLQGIICCISTTKGSQFLYLVVSNGCYLLNDYLSFRFTITF